jgi:hypothetical protein
VRAERLTAAQLAERPAGELAGAVLLAAAGALPRGTRLDPEQADALRRAIGPVLLGWLDPDDVHEDEAAWRLARAVAGSGVVVGAPRESRVDLTAERAGVLHVNVEPLARLNRMDPLEVFTLPHGEPVRAGEVVAGVKVAPHVVPAAVVKKGEAFATGNTRLVRVAPYVGLDVGAIAAEELADDALHDFEAMLRTRCAAYGGQLDGVARVAAAGYTEAESRARGALEYIVLQRRIQVVLVGGVAAADELSPFFSALDTLGGRMVRRGLPARPGSMFWMAELSGARIFGAPRCRAFSAPGVIDRILARLLTGEALTAEALAELGHGGLARGAP